VGIELSRVADNGIPEWIIVLLLLAACKPKKIPKKLEKNTDGITSKRVCGSLSIIT
jgi:hypothetical protein